jgi:hypothetical protein
MSQQAKMRLGGVSAAMVVSMLALFLSACGTVSKSPCDNSDGALDDAAFVFVTSPVVGQRVGPGFPVSGCSRTFESNVPWRLLARNGDVLASGNTSGGGVDGSGAFSFTVPFTIDERQIGHLEVYDEDVSDGEGFPPGRNVIPLVLLPGG